MQQRVLRRVLETAFEKVLRRALRRCLAVCFTRRKGFEKPLLRRGSKRGLSRRHLEGRSRLFESTTLLACALDWSLFSAYRGLFGADLDPIPPDLTAARRQQKIPLKGPFWAQWRLLGEAPVC